MNDALTLSPIIAWIGALSLLLNFGLSVYSLLVSGSRANKNRLDGHDTRLNEHDNRVRGIEQSLGGFPGREDIHGLQLTMANVGGEMREMRAIMVRLEGIVTRHEAHLLDGGKR